MRYFFPYAATALLLLPSSAFGAHETITPTQGHDVWDAAAGFPGGYVYAVTQTADGYIWIGTSRGLVRYDGLNFVPIRGSEPGGDTAFPVLGAVVDSQDQLWATDDHTHLYRYDGQRLVGPLPDNGKHLYLTSLLGKTRDGSSLFVSELQGLVEYVNGSARVLLDPRAMPHDPLAVTEIADGAFWIGTDAGMFRLTFPGGSPEVHPFQALANIKVNCLLAVGDSVLFIGTDRGLMKLHDGQIAPVRPDLSGVEILALTSGREGDIWIGVQKQVFRAHAKDIEKDGSIRALDSFNVRGSVTSLFEDRNNDLWIGGPELLERYRASAFTTFSTSAGLPCANCGAIYVDRHNRTWFAPWDGGLFVLAQGSIQAITAAGIGHDSVYSIEGGTDDEVWVGRKNGGITRLDFSAGKVQAKTYTRQDGLAQNSVYSIYAAPDGSLWAGTLFAGLSQFRNGSWHTFTTNDGLPSNTISAITGNIQGDVFVGTPDGLGVLAGGRWTSYAAEQGLPPGEIRSLLLDSAGMLWIGTTKGISFLQNETVHVPLGAPNALYGEILGIAESRGWLWITTRNHVVRVRRAASANESISAGDYREFGPADGLASTEGVRRSRSVVPDSHGLIWFSLNKGISALEPSAFSSPLFPVTTHLADVVVDGRSVAIASFDHVPPGRHRLTFRYVGVNVSNPDGVKYRYRLDGVDTGWSETTSLREIDYTNLPPGRLGFHVTARNPDGTWSDQEATVNFEVDPEYWQTRWFQLGSVVALLLLTFGAYQLRLRQLQRQFHAVVGVRVNERTRIARELHDTLLQSLHGLMFQFQAARNMLPGRTADAIQTLDGAINATEEAIAESRGAIHDLRTDAVRNIELDESLRAAAQELTDSYHTAFPVPAFQLIVEGERKALSAAFHAEIYRIAREVLRNAYEHSRADRIEVELRYGDHALRLRIRDNGRGIDPKIVKAGGSPGHWGLRGIRERSQQIGAKLDFWTEINAGTEVQLTVPAAVAYESAGDLSKRRRSRLRPNIESE